MLKKIIGVLLSMVFVLGLSACGNNTSNNGKSDNSKAKQTTNNSIKESSKSKLPEMKLNQPFEVKTESGNYTLTIEGARKTDKRNSLSEKKVKEVVFLDYTYDNKSFGEKDNANLLIDNTTFQVLDDEGNVLDVYPTSDENRQVLEVPAGGKCKASEAYALDTNSKHLKVIFIRGTTGEKISTITVDIK
ncbi:hypothetical protein [Clostridium tyrobutyricum]|uniref:hypothetical protein n=1 Tax=Clostridium tyrobutyricum TaxID=1519 RepID=UPI002B21E7CF|nr:hypothetical protein [Clostridium tyrobutyricum]MEA5008227.1 hypothetical protein [Clostridium tyrobutyricum]